MFSFFSTNRVLRGIFSGKMFLISHPLQILTKTMSFLYNKFFAFLLVLLLKNFFESVANALNKFIAFFFLLWIAGDDFLFEIMSY